MNESIDRIFIEGLRVACVIGTGEEERKRAQEITIDVCLHLDLEEPGRSDRLEDTVDYGSLAEEITAMAESSSFQLLERLQNRVREEAATPGTDATRPQRIELIRGVLRRYVAFAGHAPHLLAMVRSWVRS